MVASSGSDWRRTVVAAPKDNDRERERVRGLASTLAPLSLSLYQTMLVPVLVSSWYSAGLGWSMTYRSEIGRRRGSWGKCSKVEWLWLKCRMEPWRFGVKSNEKVLSWDVLRRSDDKDRLDLGADFDAHRVGCRKIEVNHAWKTEMPS